MLSIIEAVKPGPSTEAADFTDATARTAVQETYMTVYMNIWYLGQVPDGGGWSFQHPVPLSLARLT